MPTRLNFGPDLPPINSEVFPGQGRTIGPRRDGLEVEEDIQDVAHKLATAAGDRPQFRQIRGRERVDVRVNPAAVRYVAPA